MRKPRENCRQARAERCWRKNPPKRSAPNSTTSCGYKRYVRLTSSVLFRSVCPIIDRTMDNRTAYWKEANKILLCIKGGTYAYPVSCLSDRAIISLSRVGIVRPKLYRYLFIYRTVRRFRWPLGRQYSCTKYNARAPVVKVPVRDCVSRTGTAHNEHSRWWTPRGCFVVS